MALNIMKSGTWGECLWGIDDTGFMVIDEGCAASISEERDIPWFDYADKIKEVELKGRVTLPENASLHALFKDCINLEKINLPGLDTSNVEDMSSMFENCINLKKLDLSTFNTTNVLNMNRMFYGCKSLANLDLSSFVTHNAEDMLDMFNKCKNLFTIIIGDNFSAVGNGQTDCGNLSFRETGKYKVAKVVGISGGLITYHENRGENFIEEAKSVTGCGYIVEKIKYDSPGPEYVFMGWNTMPNGKGDTYMPGEEIASVDDDIDLYAIWACPPKIGRVEQLSEITYGQPLPFVLPDIYAAEEDPITGYLEISPNGKEGTWLRIDRDEIIPVRFNGYCVRLVAENACGKSYSNIVNIRIKKAGIDLSKLHWAEDDNMFYDGTTKKVWLEGLREGVTAVYSNNVGIEAGERVATVELEFDKENYDIPFKIKPHTWTIKKAKIDMSNVAWDYEEPFVYDGTEKKVSLVGVPEGVIPHYERNTATEAGVLTATASFTYDTENYQKIDEILPCTWEIKKACIEAKTLEWTSCNDFIYTGKSKRVEIKNLPADTEVKYLGNEETFAGRYIARAVLARNYYTDEPIEYEWEIKKAKFDISRMSWNYEKPFVYDRQLHEISLNNVPEGLMVEYFNNEAIDSGEYEAIATFDCEDTHNYAVPENVSVAWKIQQVVVDMSGVKWNYQEPFCYDGGMKNVELEGLPEGIFATIENGSAIQAGIYRAHANLQYDRRNFIIEQPADCQWQITKNKYDISNVRWNYEEPFVYDGEEKSLFLLNVPEGLNVEYSNNIKLNAGKYVASAKLIPSDISNYEIPVVNACTWAINKAALNCDKIAWTDDRAFSYDGNPKTVKIISEIDDKLKVEYSGNTELYAGQHEATATFIPVDEDNYEAPAPVRHIWGIGKGVFDFKDATWNYTSEFTYDGIKKIVELSNVPEGVIVHYENNEEIDCGEYEAIASFELTNQENYYELKPMKLKWSIKKNIFDFTNVAWQENVVFKYDGTPKTVELSGLPKNITPVYTENTAIASGEYIAEVSFEYDERNYEKPTFKGCKWTIEKSEFNIGNATWDYMEPFVYDGEIKKVSVVGMPEGATIQYGNAAAADAGFYFATAEVIAEDDKNYLSTSMPDLAWRIDKGNFDMTNVYWDYDSALTYDGTEKTIVLKGLPEGLVPMYVGNCEKESGEYVASVTFKVLDAKNYNTPVFPDCTWKIDKARIDMSEVKWSYSNPLTYANMMYEVKLLNLPKGVQALYTGNTATDVGKYIASADFILDDDLNYYQPTFSDCNWEIIKADYDMSETRWDYYDEIVYDGCEHAIYLENVPIGVSIKYSDNTAIEAGKYTARAVLGTNNPENYNVPTMADCEWEIKKSDVDMKDITWNYDEQDFVYDGKSKKVQLMNVPDFLKVAYIGEEAVDAGRYIATAEFEVLDPNFNKPDKMSLEWSIAKATCDMSNVTWNYTEEFTYNGQPQGIEIVGLPEILNVHCENNRNVDAGTYMAVARFTTITDNYLAPNDLMCDWKINKARCDVSAIAWDYSQPFVYDGQDKAVRLTGVPDILTVNYTGNVASQAGKYIARADLIPVDARNYFVPDSIEIEWEISKAEYDMSQTRWSIDRKFEYNGSNRAVVLEGYPASISPIYECNTAVETGKYTANAKFKYDTTNYNEPKVAACKWEIVKSNYDMSKVKWTYFEPFVYSGKSHTVELAGLPKGLKPVYKSNTAINAGEYKASVTFEYDDKNYKKPTFDSCKWVINKAIPKIDESKIKWSYTAPFEYDGKAKSIQIATHLETDSIFDRIRGKKPELRLVGIPKGYEVISYEENEKTEIGVYYAKAVLRNETDKNFAEYELTPCRWEIKKAKVDMSNAVWHYEQPCIFDGAEKKVELIGLPDNVSVTYANNTAIKAGSYEAQAMIEVTDPEHYEKPKPIKACWWTIEKASYDMSKARWTYEDEFIYDGKEKSVSAVDLPEGVKVESYSGNKGIEPGTYIAEVKFRFENPDNFKVPELPALKWVIKESKK